MAHHLVEDKLEEGALRFPWGRASLGDVLGTASGFGEVDCLGDDDGEVDCLGEMGAGEEEGF